MINLLQETIEILQRYDKTEQDVKWVGDSTHKISWKQFKRYANFEYDNGYGGAEIRLSIVIVGNDFWFQRREYDGSEWWEYKEFPQEPAEVLPDDEIESFIKVEW